MIADTEMQRRLAHCTTEELTAALMRLLAAGELAQRDVIALAVRGLTTTEDSVLAHCAAVSHESEKSRKQVEFLGAIVGAEVTRRFWNANR